MGSQGMTGGIKIVSEANLGSFGEITATRTTNTFTPTTLKNIEQMFLEEEVLCPEEEERRRLRRERNKLAAARCRKRRVDQTDTLQEEVELWEGKKRVLQEQIQALQSEREELQFILEAHRSVCTRGVLGVRSQNIQSNIVNLGPRVVVKTEPEVQETSTTSHMQRPWNNNNRMSLSHPSSNPRDRQ